MLSPCQCKVSLDMHRSAGHAHLPDLKALVDVDGIKVQLTPESVGVLSMTLAECQAPDAGSNSKKDHVTSPDTEVSLSLSSLDWITGINGSFLARSAETALCSLPDSLLSTVAAAMQKRVQLPLWHYDRSCLIHPEWATSMLYIVALCTIAYCRLLCKHYATVW